MKAKAQQLIEAMAAETGASALWGGFNVHLAAGIHEFTELRWLTVQTMPRHYSF